MSTQLTNNAEALRLFLTEDIYLVGEKLADLQAEKASNKQVLVSSKLEPELQNVSVEIPSEQPLPILEEPKEIFKKTFDFKYKGKNQKNILILVEDATNDLSTKEGTEFLTKLMNAIKVTGNDVALINYHHYIGATYDDFFEALNCALMLSFGVMADVLVTPSAELHGLIQHGPSKIVYTQHLHILAGDELAKRKLWNTLKTLI